MKNLLQLRLNTPFLVGQVIANTREMVKGKTNSEGVGHSDLFAHSHPISGQSTQPVRSQCDFSFGLSNLSQMVIVKMPIPFQV